MSEELGIPVDQTIMQLAHCLRKPISSEEDIRELITLAKNKGVAREIEYFRELGFVATLPSPRENDALKYEQEREGR